MHICLMHLLFRKRLRCALQDANYGLWIIGIISAATLAASAIIAFMEFFVSITGNAGRHTAGLAFPMGYRPLPEPQMCAWQGHFGHSEELSVRNEFLCALRPNCIPSRVLTWAYVVSAKNQTHMRPAQT